MAKLAYRDVTSLYSAEEDDEVPLSTLRKGYAPPNPERRNLPPTNQPLKHSPNGNLSKLSNYPSSPLANYIRDNSSHPDSNRSSTTLLGSNSHISSNRSSRSYHNNDPNLVNKRSGRGTPSSDNSEPPYGAKSSEQMSNKTKSASNLVQLTESKPDSKPAKKKGFSFFNLFRRGKKKDPVVPEESEPEELKDHRSPAEIKAEELKKIHEEEFAKLRRQREKDKNRSFYEMLPASRQPTPDISSVRSVSSPVPSLTHSQKQTSISSQIYPPHHSPQTFGSPGYPIQQPVTHNYPHTPRARSASTTNVSQYHSRPASSYSNSQFNAPQQYEQGYSRSSLYNPQSNPGFRSTDTLGSYQSRSHARSPLIPAPSPNSSRSSQHFPHNFQHYPQGSQHIQQSSQHYSQSPQQYQHNQQNLQNGQHYPQNQHYSHPPSRSQAQQGQHYFSPNHRHPRTKQ